MSIKSHSQVGLLITWFSFFCVTLLVRLCERTETQSLLAVALLSAGFALAYCLLYLAICRYSIWKLSLIWLGIPYFIFAFGWLRWYWAISCSAIWLIALYRTAALENGRGTTTGWQQIVGLLLLLIWVYLSGVGGHGNQSPDYIAHNGRLMDLIAESWPVHYRSGRWVDDTDYGINKTFLIFYLAYYLPAALAGKAFGMVSALECLHLWTLLGCWLALVWLWEFIGRRYALLITVVFIMFGGWDIVGTLLYSYGLSTNTSLLTHWHALLHSLIHDDPARIDFWTRIPFKYFVGNFLSNASQLFWSPHQIIAGWITAALLMRTYLSGRIKQVGFVYALLVFWSPMTLMTLALFPLLLILHKGQRSLREAISFENIVAGGSMLLIFGLYYLGGSALKNPANWMWNLTDLNSHWLPLLVLHFFSWGIYGLVILGGWRKYNPTEKLWHMALFTTILILPFSFYGTYNDLVCRGSAPLVFLLLISFMQRLVYLRNQNGKILATAAFVLLIPGTLSFALHLKRSFLHFDEKFPAQSVAIYGYGWEMLGSTDYFFTRYLSRQFP
jgi:hypothetical protein